MVSSSAATRSDEGRYVDAGREDSGTEGESGTEDGGTPLVAMDEAGTSLTGTDARMGGLELGGDRLSRGRAGKAAAPMARVRRRGGLLL
jgi:hypothetical protein